jgi:hypothetical protein
MSKNVTLKISNVDGETRTKLYLDPDDTITFRNEAQDRDLTIILDKPDVLVGKNVQRDRITVSPRSSETCTITPKFRGEFKYTAVIHGATAEDPIIIVG